MVEKQKAVVENGVQKIRITAEKGYSPKEFQLQMCIRDRSWIWDTTISWIPV